MPAFEINLIRRETIPVTRRRVLFWSLIVYLLICGVALVLTVHHATLRLIAARPSAVASGADNGPRGDVTPLVRRLQRELTEHAGRLERIEGVLTQRVNLPAILRGLALPLPDGVTIINVEMDGAKRDLNFDVVVPTKGVGAELTPGQLVVLWNADTALMSRVSRIRSVSSQRHKFDEAPVFVMRFNCRMGGGGI